MLAVIVVCLRDVSDILNIEYLGLQLAEFGTKCLADENPLNWGSQLVIEADGYRCGRRA